MTEQDTATTETPAGDPRRTPIIDAQLAVIVARCGDQLTEEQRAEIRTRLARGLSLADKLRSVPLGNADEPEIVFVPYRMDV
jgi:DNA-directed RNA polymerase specialized sigma24 family protein